MEFRAGVDQAADDAAWDGFAACMARTNSPAPGTPLREHLERDGKRHVDRMHPLGRQDVDRSGHRRRHGRHQHSIGTVLEFLDNQSRNLCLFDLGERRRKAWFVRLTSDASGEAPQQRVAGEPLQYAPLNGILRP